MESTGTKKTTVKQNSSKLGLQTSLGKTNSQTIQRSHSKAELSPVSELTSKEAKHLQIQSNLVIKDAVEKRLEQKIEDNFEIITEKILKERNSKVS